MQYLPNVVSANRLVFVKNDCLADWKMQMHFYLPPPRSGIHFNRVFHTVACVFGAIFLEREIFFECTRLNNPNSRHRSRVLAVTAFRELRTECKCILIRATRRGGSRVVHLARIMQFNRESGLISSILFLHDRRSYPTLLEKCRYACANKVDFKNC